MSFSDDPTVCIVSVTVDDDRLTVDLTDGRTVSVPLAFYPSLLGASQEQRGHWKLIGRGRGVHWPDLDEDLSLKGILMGTPSAQGGQRLAG